MTLSVPASPRRDRYVASAGQTVFPYNFRVLAPTDIRVERLRVNLVTPLLLGVDFDVDGVGNPAGGHVVLLTPAQAGDVLAITSEQELARTTAFTESGDFLASSVNAEFDRMWIALQQLAQEIRRQLVAPASDAVGLDYTLPLATARAGKFLAFDSNGRPTVSGGVSGGSLNGISLSQLGADLIARASPEEIRELLGLILGVNVLAPDGDASGLTGMLAGNVTGLHPVAITGNYTQLEDLPDIDVAALNDAVAAMNALTGDLELEQVKVVTELPGAGDPLRVLDQLVVLTSDRRLYRWDGTAWVTHVATADEIEGQLQDSQVQALSASKLLGTVTETQIAPGAITTPKIAAGAIDAGTIATGAVSALKIQAGAVTASAVAAGAITSDKLAANSVTAAKIAAGAISADVLAAGSITSDKLASNAVLASKIIAGAIDSSKISVNGVSMENLIIGAASNSISGALGSSFNVTGAWSNLLGISLTTVGRPRLVVGTAAFRLAPTYLNSLVLDVQLMQNGTPISLAAPSFVYTYAAGLNSVAHVVITVSAMAPAIGGFNAYYLQAKINSGSGTITATNRTLFVLEHRR